MIVINSNINAHVKQALKSIVKILSEYPLLEVSMIVYDKIIRVIEIKEGGRVIELTKGSEEVIC